MVREPRFLSNHARALSQLARRPDSRLRDLAAALGVSERAAQTIVNDLVGAGCLERVRQGRRNRYLVREDRELADPLGPRTVGDLLRPLAEHTAPGGQAGCAALVLACSDHWIQGWLRSLLADQRLLDRAEIVLWPGGGASLIGPHRDVLYETLAARIEVTGAGRVLLVAHSDCRVPGVRPAGRRDPVRAFRMALSRQRKIINETRRRLHVEPEVWLVNPGRSTQIRVERTADRARRHAGLAG